MFRFYFVIATSVISFIYFYTRFVIIKRHPNRYTDTQKYALARFACRNVERKGRITTKIYGLENLPKNGGYIMYPNHQGRYDAVGIFLAHEKPCSFVVDAKRSQVLLLNQISDLVGAKRLDKHDMRGQIEIINAVADEVAEGKKYIIFPEGGYGATVTDNNVRDFMPGCFKAALKSKCPIVPVVLVDSYKVFGSNSLKRVTCQIHFLESIPYEFYKDMKTKDISTMVYNLITDKLAKMQAI